MSSLSDFGLCGAIRHSAFGFRISPRVPLTLVQTCYVVLLTLPKKKERALV